MIIRELEKAIKRFDIDRYKMIFKPADDLRKDFIGRFPLSKIKEMKITEYVQGRGKEYRTFCYGIEWELGCLGLIVGATAKKFGIYFDKHTEDYVVTKYWKKSTIEQSFKFLRNQLYKLIEAGGREDIETLRDLHFSPMFKGKILSTYYPEKYLSVFSEDHLDFFIHSLDLDNELPENPDIFDKKRILTEFKLSHKVMAKWPLHAFAHFLYTEYPGDPRKKDETIQFLKGAELITGDFVSLKDNDANKVLVSGKGDYEKQHQAQQKLGERGEYVVLQYEIRKLKQHNIRKKPIQISSEDDTAGYDIESYNINGEKIFIEVKATNSTPADFKFFISANELSIAKELKDAYHIYVVFRPNSSQPEIFDIGNPFIEKDKVNLIPVNYKLHLKRTIEKD